MMPVNILMYEHVERDIDVNELNLERRLMRDNSDAYALPDRRFIELFRLNKDMVNYLLQELTPHMRQSRKVNAVPAELRVFAALLFFATGSYQRTAGQAYLLSMSQQSVGRAIHEVSTCIYEHLCGQWLQFPRAAEDKLRLKQLFMNRTGFPGTIGAIDCTHIAILKPIEEEHNYLNRKNFHSKNVQIVCEYNLKILSINARYGGASHDSFIWRNSRVREEMQRCYREGDRNSWLVGDSGYPQQPWLMTPILDAIPNSPEDRYNTAHCSARNCVERCNGVLKTRFRCLLGERTLRYSPPTVGVIVTACAVLHNICVEGGLELPNNVEVPPNVNNDLNVGEPQLEILDEGRRVRQNIINNYYNH